MASDSGGLSRFKDGRFLRVFDPLRANLTLVETVTTDLDGGLWFTDNAQGVFRWKDNTLKSFGGVAEVRGKMGTSAITDGSGRIWIGFADGSLVAYEAGKFRTYSREDGLPAGGVASISEDRAGAIWVGTTTGLSRFENDRFASLTSRNGLPVNNVSAIVEDDQGYIWFGVTSGIIRLKPSEFDKAVADPAYHAQYILYDMSDGLPGVPMSVRGRPTVARGLDGTLWFVTSNGLAVIDPRQPKKGRLPPPVRVERIIADERTLDVVPQLQLDPLTSRVQIEYTGLSFTVPSKVRFRYKLEGFDSNWVDAGTRRQAFYTNLSPRRYRFRVIAENDGVWNEAGAVLDFSIKPAFYQTDWFRATCAIAFGLVMVAAWRFRVRQVHRRFGLVLTERTRMAREIHDTLLQGLVGIGLRFDSLSCITEGEPLRKEFERLRDQIETSIREARQSIWDLRSPMLQTSTLVSALQEAGESMTHGSGVRFELSVTGTPLAKGSRVEEVLLRIGHEAISNAVRHAQATRIRMELCYDEGSVTLRVTDDGRGFDFDGPLHTVEERWGLASMQERAQQIRAQFRIMSTPVAGTTVEVIAPCS